MPIVCRLLKYILDGSWQAIKSVINAYIKLDVNQLHCWLRLWYCVSYLIQEHKVIRMIGLLAKWSEKNTVVTIGLKVKWRIS